MVDRWFGFFMEKVDELGLLKDTLILFTADHGHYLNYPGDGGLIGKPLGYKGERFPMYQSLINIPLIVRMPACATAVSSFQASLTAEASCAHF